MTDTLHPVIAGYVDDVNARDNQSLIRRFTPEAVVIDEGEAHRGHAEIRPLSITGAAAPACCGPQLLAMARRAALIC
jgi:hypothetical protein